jgi:AraC-like DNA-binding protein
MLALPLCFTLVLPSIMPNQHTDGPGPIALQYQDQILAKLMQGARLIDIAPDLGISPQAISKALKTDPTYRHAVEVAMEIRIDKAEAAIEAAAEQVDVARARAAWQSAAWRAEREFPHRWGQRSTIDVNVNIGDALQAIAERVALAQQTNVIDADVMRITDVMTNSEYATPHTSTSGDAPA